MSRDSRLERFSSLPRLSVGDASLPPAQRELWPALGAIPDDFVLYGGTALALRLGHRESVDFDFFSAASFAPTDLLASLGWLGHVTARQAGPDTLVISTPGGVHLAFYGGVGIQAVAEPSIAEANGLVVASVFDLAGTKAKAIIDRAEWRDYVDIAALLDAGHALPDIIGYATTIFAPQFEFPAAAFLRSLVYFEEGTAADVPASVRNVLEAAVQLAEHAPIPVVTPFASSILP